jgi:hypothetical protein
MTDPYIGGDILDQASEALRLQSATRLQIYDHRVKLVMRV